MKLINYRRIKLTILVLFMIPFSFIKINGQEAIMSIKGENISAEEFAFYMKSQRALCYSYFYTQYNINQNPEFWTTSYSGERPIDYIRIKTLETLSEVKVHLLLAIEFGIINDISFKAFLTRFDEENKRRKVATEKGEPIYGPKEFSREKYFSYWHSNLLIELRKKWMAELEITDDSIRFYYNRVKTQYRKSDEISLILFSTSFKEQKEQEEAIQKLNLSIKNHLLDENTPIERGIRIEKLTIALNENIEAEEQVLEWHRIAEELEVGQSSLPIIDERTKMVRVLYCEKYKAGNIPDLEEIKNIVIQNYKEECFQQAIMENLKDLEVKILSPDLEDILLRYLK